MDDNPNGPRRANSTNPRPGQYGFPRGSRRNSRHQNNRSQGRQNRSQHQHDYSQSERQGTSQDQRQGRGQNQNYEGNSYTQGAYYSSPHSSFAFSRSRESFFRREPSSGLSGEFSSSGTFGLGIGEVLQGVGLGGVPRFGGGNVAGGLTGFALGGDRSGGFGGLGLGRIGLGGVGLGGLAVGGIEVPVKVDIRQAKEERARGETRNEGGERAV